MGLIQLFFLGVGIVGLVQLTRVKAANAEDYPELPANEFYYWKHHKLKSIYYYIWAGLGVLVIQVLLIVVFTRLIPSAVPEVTESIPHVVNFFGFIVLFILGIIGAGHSDKARKIAKTHNIKKIPR